MGTPLASSPASLPTFSSEWTHTPTRSRSGRSLAVTIDNDPMPPVDHTTTRFTSAPSAMVAPFGADGEVAPPAHARRVGHLAPFDVDLPRRPPPQHLLERD